MIVHGFYVANFCWTFCIAFNFYQMIVRRNRESESLEKWYALPSLLPSPGTPNYTASVDGPSTDLNFPSSQGITSSPGVFPVSACCAPPACSTTETLAERTLHPSQSQHIAIRAHTSDVAPHSCYVTSALYIFLFFFIPGLTIISLNAILFFFVIREIHETLASAPKTDKKDKKKEIRVYISIFISIGISFSSSFSSITGSLAHTQLVSAGLSWIFGFFMVLFPERIVQLIFLTLFSIFTPAQGFLIFIFYCLNFKVRQAVPPPPLCVFATARLRAATDCGILCQSRSLVSTLA